MVVYRALAALLAFASPLRAEPTSQPVVPATQPAVSAAPNPGIQVPQHFETKTGYEYLFYLPHDYDKDQAKAWPLVLFLHGSGERGTNIEDVKKHGPPKLVEGGKQFPFILVSPQCPPGKWWDSGTLEALIDDVQAKYHVDPDRIYATGLSMGGFGTWDLARHYPSKFAAIVPICGGGDPQFVKSYAHVPVWAFHGEDDHTVPIKRSEEMVDALKAAGDTEVKFTRYPGVGHDSWVKAYQDPDLYEWLLSHKREPAPQGEKKAAASFPRFRVQEIDKTLTVGYGVKLVDINGDGRPDIVVADSARVIWFENPGASAGADSPWKLHTILQDKEAGVKIDNVCIDAWDIDGDGRLDLVLGADWQPGNTNGGGSLQWLSRGKSLDEPWTVHPILATLPTLHRAHFGDLDGSGRPTLVVGPLKGTGSTAAQNFTDAGSHLLVFDIPKDPANHKWEPRVLTDELHVLHNFLAVPAMDPRTGQALPGAQARQVLTASYEGVNLLTPSSEGKASLAHLGAGNQDNPKASRGSSEIKIGHLKGGKTFLATVEPFHGNQVVIYTPPGERADPGTLWTRTVLDDTLKAGHGVWCADLNGDGNDEVVVGWREGARTGIRLFKNAGADTADARQWTASDLDIGGVAVEDLAAADLNGDGRIDLVAVGRATHNVRIYWNEGTAASGGEK